MKKEPTFTEFIEHICYRPLMYCLKGSFYEISAYISGYCSAKETPISGTDFNRFVCIKNSFPTNYVWTSVIINCAKDDEDAISIMKNTILEFSELKNQMNEDELMQYAIENTNSIEGKPEKIFREFDFALLKGKENLIKPLIEYNSNAKILWNGSYPEDVILGLSEISKNQPIKCISTSNENKVKIISQSWPFPIEMNYNNGKWKVNAEKIIELRMKIQKSK